MDSLRGRDWHGYLQYQAERVVATEQAAALVVIKASGVSSAGRWVRLSCRRRRPDARAAARRYFLLIGLAVAPLLAVGNAYGTGLTDWNMASLYTKVRRAASTRAAMHIGFYFKII
jgi:hypothetical protein